MVNSVTACNEAATALPGSTLRVRITPSDGARIQALARLISSVDRAACASATPARALVSSATARATAARPASSSAAEGTLPPDKRATSSRRARLALASLSVACFWPTAACAEASPARERRIWSRSLAVSSSTSTWPFLMRSFRSTLTLSTVPDSSLPMLMARVGCRVPLAVTRSVRLPRTAGWVTKLGAALAVRLLCHHHRPAAARTNSKSRAQNHVRRYQGRVAGAPSSWVRSCAGSAGEGVGVVMGS